MSPCPVVGCWAGALAGEWQDQVFHMFQKARARSAGESGVDLVLQLQGIRHPVEAVREESGGSFGFGGVILTK